LKFQLLMERGLKTHQKNAANYHARADRDDGCHSQGAAEKAAPERFDSMEGLCEKGLHVNALSLLSVGKHSV
jgi:hypothetical protein